MMEAGGTPTVPFAEDGRKGRVYVRDGNGRFARVPGASDARIAAWVQALVGRWTRSIDAGVPLRRRYRHNVREVATVSRSLRTKLAAEGVTVTGGKLFLTARRIDRMTRPGSKKGRGAALPVDAVADMPRLLRSPMAVLVLRGQTDGFYVVAPISGQRKLARIFVKTDGVVRMPARRGQKRQDTVTNVVWSASLVERAILADANSYRLVWGGVMPSGGR